MLCTSSPPTAPRGLIFIGLAAISWGTTGSVSTVLVARAGATPLLIGVARMWVAAVLLLLAARAIDGAVAIAPGDRWRCIAMGACMALFQAAYFTAVTLTGITVTALVAICSAPLTIAALAPSVLGERISPRIGAALALGVAGTGLLILGPQSTVAPAGGFIAGAALALTAGLAYGLYAIVAKASLARTTPLSLAAATFSAAALLLTPVLLWTEAPGRQIALGWPWLLYLGGVATAAAYAMYTIGLRSVPASVAGIVTLMEPLTAMLFGVVVFGERLGLAGAVGALLMFSALTLVMSEPRG